VWRGGSALRRAVAAGLCLCGLGLLGRDAPALTLDEAFARAAKRHPSLSISREALARARVGVDQARTGYLPGATLDANYGLSTSNFVLRPGSVPSSVGSLKSSSSLSLNGFWSSSASARWTAWDFGLTRARIAAADQGTEAAQRDLDSARARLWIGVATAYLNVLGAEAAVQVARETKQQTARRLDLARKKVEARVRPKLDVLKAESDLAAADVGVLRAEETVRTARVALGSVMADPRAITDPLVAPPLRHDALGAPDLETDARLDALVHTAASTRPEIAALESRMEAQRAAIQAAKRVVRPTLYVSGQGSYSGPTLDTLTYNYGLTFGVSFPLSTAWTQDPAIADAEVQLRAIAAQRDTAVLDLRSDVEQGRTAWLQAQKRLPAVKLQLTLALATLEDATARYEAGIGTPIEVADAETAVAQARLQRVQVDLDLAVATAKLLWALGGWPGR